MTQNDVSTFLVRNLFNMVDRVMVWNFHFRDSQTWDQKFDFAEWNHTPRFLQGRISSDFGLSPHISHPIFKEQGWEIQEKLNVPTPEI